MRLPHITIEYREEETYALESISLPLLAGFSIHWALMFLMVANVVAKPSFFPVFLASTAVVLSCYAIFLQQARNLFSTPQKRRRNRLIGACLLEVSLILMLIPGTEGLQSILVILAGLFAGCGSAILLMSFGVNFSVCDLPAVVVSTAAAFPLGALILGGILLLDSYLPALATVLCLTFPFLELISLTVSSTKLIDNLEFINLTIPVYTRKLVLHLGFPSLIFGFMIGLMQLRFTLSFLLGAAPLDAVVPIILAGLLMGVALLMAMFTQRKAHNFAFRTLMPLVALLIALSLLFTHPAYHIFSTFACFIIFLGCMWIMLSDISQRFRISVFSVFGFGYSALLLGSLIAFLIAMPKQPLSIAWTNNEVFFALMLVCLTWGLSTLPRNSELLRTLKRGKACPAFREDVLLEETPLVEPHYAQMVENARDTSTEGGNADENTETEAPVKREGLTEGHNYPCIPSEAATEEVQQSTTASTTAETASPDFVTRTTAETRAAAQTPVQDTVTPALPALKAIDEVELPSTPASNAGRFKRKCAAVANMFLLSRKETEVLYLLARGRNSATIQESLYISAGTANTHMRHIYRKLDVHSQRELIDLVESIDPGPDAE